MAALRFPGSLFAQFVWPVFGAAAVVGIGLSIALRHIGHSHQRLAIVLWLQGLGVVASCVLPGMGGLVIGALLVGGVFFARYSYRCCMAANWRRTIPGIWRDY
jgi:hypothetical protein